MSQPLPNDQGLEVKAETQTVNETTAEGRLASGERMRLAERAARQIIVGQPACTVTVDAQLVICDVDAAGAAWAELDEIEQARGRSLLGFISPHQHEAVRAAAILVFGGQMRHFRATAVTAKGRRRIVDAWTSLASAPSVAQPRVSVTLFDITDLSMVEAERDLLASMVHTAPDPVIRVSREARITNWNPAAEKLYGYSAREALGCGFDLCVPPEGLDEAKAAFAGVIKTGATVTFEQRRRKRNENLVDVWLAVFPTYDSAGNITGAAGIARDVTERKRIENELTATRDAALEGAQTRSRFMANMSHEIRTPLNSIIGMTGLWLDTPLSGEQLELARDVRDRGETLLGVINDILDFSKIAAGELVLEETDFDLTAAVEATVELVADRARHKDLKLTTSIGRDAPRLLRGDPGRLRQALLNLVDNAIKFTESGNVTVRVSKIGERPADATLRFEVRDSGIGIPKDKLNLLFKPSSQVDASATRHFGGTGLGLSITRELVARMNGGVGVRSTAGVGSTFWFTARFAKQAEAPRGEPLPSLAGRRVLIVDENQRSREILSRQVAAWGMAPEAVNRAEAALEAVQARVFNLKPQCDCARPANEASNVARERPGKVLAAQASGDGKAFGAAHDGVCAVPYGARGGSTYCAGP